ncbi:MAG: HNH endonuclease [Kineosporiaceae bacterium]|nr:HNH endonuclease [Kineosporiaceae bacterium]
MFTADLLHDADAEVARLGAEVEALREQVKMLGAENVTLRKQAAGNAARLSARAAVWDWFTDGGPENEDDRDAVAGRICRTFLTPGTVEPSLVTVAAVTLAQSQPSGLSDAEVVSAAVACRQAITHIELTQAQLTRELAWRYQARHPHELDLDVEVNLPTWVRDPEERALTAAIEEVAAVARISPSGLRARVEMLATWPEDHGRLYRALLDGSISTTRAREVARQTARLAAGRARDWVEQMILPVAEQLGTVGLRHRIERLIAQADAVAYRRILDDAAAEPDTVKVSQQGYGRAAITYRGSLTNIAELHAALLHRVRAATCPATGTNPSAGTDADTGAGRGDGVRGGGSVGQRERQAASMAQVMFDLITDPDTIPPLLPTTPGSPGDGDPDTATTTQHTTTPHAPEPTQATTAPATGDEVVGDDATGDDATSGGLLGGGAVSAPAPACPGIRVEPKVSLNVTIPFQVLAALWAGQPPPTGSGWVEATGHGPIPTDALAAILDKYGQRALWRCQVLDDRPDSPTYGTLIAIGRAATDPGYTPSPFVKTLVKAARPRCSHPGCGRPAIEADLDHVTAHSKGGTTSEQNLAPLCRFHHLLKHHAGFTPTLDPTTGQVTWRTPSGHLVSEPPDMPPPLATEGDLPGAWPLPPADSGRDSEPPPF